MNKKISGDEVTAAAQNATVAKQKAAEARKAAQDAGGVDETLNTAAQTAETAATAAETTATDLSQKFTDQQKDINKMKIKRADINRNLRELGEDDDTAGDDDDEDTDPLANPDRVLTARDYQRIEANKAKKNVRDLVAAVADTTERAAIQKALDTNVSRELIASNPQEAFTSARAIANNERNSKIIEESQRRSKPQIRNSGSGAPPNVEEPFEPTAEEQKFMRGSMALTKEEILAARAK